MYCSVRENRYWLSVHSSVSSIKLCNGSDHLKAMKLWEDLQRQSTQITAERIKGDYCVSLLNM